MMQCRSWNLMLSMEFYFEFQVNSRNNRMNVWAKMWKSFWTTKTSFAFETITVQTQRKHNESMYFFFFFCCSSTINRFNKHPSGGNAIHNEHLCKMSHWHFASSFVFILFVLNKMRLTNYVFCTMENKSRNDAYINLDALFLMKKEKTEKNEK